MPSVKLRSVLYTLDGTLDQMQRLAAASQLWVSVTFPRGVPKFSVRHKETVTGLAFLRAFVAWESFLEQSFLLYLLGKKPPVGSAPRRLVSPTSRKMAVLMLVGLTGKYADWYKWDLVKQRADKCFFEGRPYASALNGQKRLFEELSIIRNAISHSSEHSQNQFKGLVRSKLLGSFPANLTVGGFLAMTVPDSSPPESFLEHYIGNVNRLAEKIIPT